MASNESQPVPYYKELNTYTGSVTATLLMTQLEYWFSKMGGKQFFKFLEPCQRRDYIVGDSWVEDVAIQKPQKSISRKGESRLPITGDYSSRIDQEIKAVDYPQDKEAGVGKDVVDLFNLLAYCRLYQRSKRHQPYFQKPCGGIKVLTALP